MVNERKATRCRKAKSDFLTKCISIAGLSKPVLAQVQKFPFPVQDLLAVQARAMLARVEDGKLPPELTAPECHCRFFSRYLLPCRHILHAHEYSTPVGGLITENHWKTFQHMFEEAGMEVYQKREWVEVPIVVETEEERKLAAYRLRANELLENLRNEFWKAVDSGDDEGIQEYLVDLEHFTLSRRM
jgi:hypothetical protein